MAGTHLGNFGQAIYHDRRFYEIPEKILKVLRYSILKGKR
jgi:hypothetical protein